jgi:hypothetical protein
MKMKDIVKEGTLDDLGLRGHGDELDNDEKDLGKGFTNDPIFDQLGQILDTRTGDNPISSVKTDDGKELPVSPRQAVNLRRLLTAEGMKPQMKLRFTKDIQMSNNLHDFLDVHPDKMSQVFMKKYM